MSDQKKIQELLTSFYDCQDQLRGYVFSGTRDFHATEEVLQDIAILVVEKAGTIDLSKPLTPWFIGVARNKVRQWHKRRGKDFKNVHFDALEECIAHAGYFESEEISLRQHALQKCLGRLPSKQKKIMELRYMNNEDCSNIATLVGRSVHSIYAYLKRIKLELRKCVEVQLTKPEAL